VFSFRRQKRRYITTMADNLGEMKLFASKHPKDLRIRKRDEIRQNKVSELVLSSSLNSLTILSLYAMIQAAFKH
jgi:hypothetical protein